MNSPIDMSAFIAAKSDQLNSDDLAGGPRTVRVTGVKANSDSAEQPISVHFEGDEGKPLKPCKTVRRIMVAVWGAQASEYVGRSMTLYRDPKVAFGGMQVGGIRISHMSHMEREMVVAANSTRGKKAAHKILPLKLAEPTAQQQPRQTPEDWLDGFLTEVAAIPVLDALASYQARKQKALDRLATDHPELHARAISALTERAEQINPPAGRSDEQHGDQFDDADPFAPEGEK